MSLLHGSHMDWKNGRVFLFEVYLLNRFLYMLNSWNKTLKIYWKMEKNTGKVMEIFQSENVGSMLLSIPHDQQFAEHTVVKVVMLIWIPLGIKIKQTTVNCLLPSSIETKEDYWNRLKFQFCCNVHFNVVSYSIVPFTDRWNFQVPCDSEEIIWK